MDVNIEGDDAARKGVIDSLTRQLKDRDATIADDAPLRIIVRTENGKSEEREYESMGGPSFSREHVKVQVTERITRITIERDGKPIWEARSVGWPPFMIMKKQGQSLADAVHDSNKHNLAFLRAARLPNRIILADSISGLRELALVPGSVRGQTR